jgi:hypothetical protein
LFVSLKEQGRVGDCIVFVLLGELIAVNLLFVRRLEESICVMWSKWSNGRMTLIRQQKHFLQTWSRLNKSLSNP